MKEINIDDIENDLIEYKKYKDSLALQITQANRSTNNSIHNENQINRFINELYLELEQSPIREKFKLYLDWIKLSDANEYRFRKVFIKVFLGRDL